MAVISLALMSFCAPAQDAPMRLQNVEAVTAWIAKAYPVHEMKTHTVKIPDAGDFTVYAFYGPRGSGTIRVDGWFYSCTKGSTCDLLAMANLGNSRYLKESAKITFEEPCLVIRSTDSTLVKLKMR
ncbi:hypothetical protein D3H34_05185 [Acidovorax cavernicola]|uniref:META domain-containing protein n=1 Tax=Acidovorax cavernicola TaxID=1675792 RepID=A0A9X8D805_9BURK|nr:hypothetical protein D3H34_05185 [Acidovorax cavernicola]